jgi:hypothetical protein
MPAGEPASTEPPAAEPAAKADAVTPANEQPATMPAGEPGSTKPALAPAEPAAKAGAVTPASIGLATVPAGEPVSAGPFRIEFNENDGVIQTNFVGPPITDEDLKFLGECQQYERLLRALFRLGEAPRQTNIERSLRALFKLGEASPQTNTNKVNDAIRRLARATKLGLEGPGRNLALGRLAARELVDDAMQVSGPIARNVYLRELGLNYVYAFGALVFFTVLFYYIPRWVGAAPSFLVSGGTLGLMAVALLSLAAGAWLTAAFRLQPNSPEVLISLFATTTYAWVRVILVLGFGFLGLLLFHTQVVVFSFGPSDSARAASGFTTALVFSKLSTAVIAGALLGLGDAALPTAVMARSSNLVAALAPR